MKFSSVSERPSPTPRQIREAAGQSQMFVAVATGTSMPTVRLFEAGGEQGVANAEKRRALSAYYAALSRQASHVGEGPRAA